MKIVVGIFAVIALAALLVFAEWAIRVEITYRNNVRGGFPNKPVLMQNNRPCRLGERCQGDRDTIF